MVLERRQIDTMFLGHPNFGDYLLDRRCGFSL
jgi:hypothetical protein